MLLACASDWELQRLPRKPNGSVWHSGLFGFPDPRPICPTGGQHVYNDRLMRSTLCGQNPKWVLTILGGSASVAVSMVRTTAPKEDKVGTSLTEAPTAQALVARQGSKVLDDTLVDDDPDLLNFDAAECEIVCQMSSRLQNSWPNSYKLDCLVWDSGWSSFRTP
jgi:hypothetical protein